MNLAAPAGKPSFPGLAAPGKDGATPAARKLPRPGALGSVLLVAFVAGFPLAVNNGYALQVLGLGWLYATLAMGTVISYGYVGIPNMSQGTLLGIGAYIAANVMTRTGLPFPVTCLLAATGAAMVGGLLGATAMRVRGNYWWMITMAFTYVAYVAFNNWTQVTGGINGFIGIPEAVIGPLRISSNTDYYYLGAAVMGLAYLGYSRVARSRVGLGLRAVREDEVAARGAAVSPGAMKIYAMTLAGGGAGLAGAALVAVTGYVNASSFNLSFSFEIMLFTIVGGIRSLRGAIVASAALTFLTTEVTSLANYQLFFLGGAVLVSLMLRLYSDAIRKRLTRWRPALLPGRSSP